MASFKFLRQFDPRIAQELRAQRRTITKGLACVLVTSILTSLMIPVIKLAVTAIEKKNLGEIAWVSLAVVVIFGIKYWFTRGQAWYLSKASALMIDHRSDDSEL